MMRSYCSSISSAHSNRSEQYPVINFYAKEEEADDDQDFFLQQRFEAPNSGGLNKDMEHIASHRIKDVDE